MELGLEPFSAALREVPLHSQPSVADELGVAAAEDEGECELPILHETPDQTISSSHC